MKNVSLAFQNELNNDNRIFINSCDITLTDGTVLPIDNSNIWENGFKIDDASSGTSSFDLGSVIIGKFTVYLNNIYDEYSAYDFTDCVVSNVKVGLLLPDGTIETVSYGKYYLNEPKYNGAIITLEFYDCLCKFDKNYSLSKLEYPATLLQIVMDACEVCDVQLGTTSFSHDDYVVQERPEDSALTFRQVLQWVGEISCNFCKSDSQGRLCLHWYHTDILESLIYGNDTETTSGYHHIRSFSSLTMSTDDVIITGVRVVQDSSAENGGGTVSYQSGTDGYVLSVEGNKLIQGDMGNTVASMLGEKLIGIRFRPFDASCLSDPTIEASDIAVITDSKGNSYNTIITSNIFQSGSYQKISCGAQTPARNSAERYSKATQAYIDYRKEIQKERTEREKALDALGERIDNSSGLFTTTETKEDGSKIHYMHNKPSLSESDIVWKMTSEAIGVSTDGGKTWNAGITVDGDAIVRILNAEGVSADWIRTGALVVKDDNGNVMFSVNMDTKQVIISGDFVRIGDKTLDNVIDGISDSLTSESIFNLLTNNGEYKGIYKEGDQLYISFTYAKGGELSVGGKNNINGALRVYDTNDEVIAIIDNDNFIINTKPKQNILYDLFHMKRLIGEIWPVIEFKATNNSQPDKNYSVLIGDCITICNSNDVDTIINNIIPNRSNKSMTINVNGIQWESAGNSILSSSALTERSVSFPDASARFKSLSVSGTKSRIANTENYNERLLYCYEMPSPMFGDIGEAETDETGECYIYLDDIFSETVSAQIEYQVFLQEEGQGKVWVDSKEPAFFVVKGTPNLKFAWEIKAKQKEYEYERLETFEQEEESQEIDYEAEYMSEINQLIHEQESVLYGTDAV